MSKMPSAEFQVTQEVVCRLFLKKVMFCLVLFMIFCVIYGRKQYVFTAHKSNKVTDFIKKSSLKGIVVPPHALSFPFEMVNDVGDYWCDVTVRN